MGLRFGVYGCCVLALVFGLSGTVEAEECPECLDFYTDWAYQVVGVRTHWGSVIVEVTGEGYRVNNPGADDSPGRRRPRRSMVPVGTASSRSLIVRAASRGGHPYVIAAVVAAGFIYDSVNDKWEVPDGEPTDYPVPHPPADGWPGESYGFRCGATLDGGTLGAALSSCVAHITTETCDVGNTYLEMYWSQQTCFGGSGGMPRLCMVRRFDNNDNICAATRVETRTAMGDYYAPLEPPCFDDCPVHTDPAPLREVIDEDWDQFVTPPLVLDAMRMPEDQPMPPPVVPAPYDFPDEVRDQLVDDAYDTFQQYLDDTGQQTDTEAPAPGDGESHTPDETMDIPPEEDYDWETVQIGPDDFAVWGDPIGGQCPAPWDITGVFGENYQFEFGPACDVATSLRPLLLLLGYFLGLLLIVRR